MYFPKRDELSFRVVLALPIASMIGLEASTLFSIEPVDDAVDDDSFPGDTVPVAMDAKYRIANFADTVLPAPDSPETMSDWFRDSRSNLEKASSATA